VVSFSMSVCVEPVLSLDGLEELKAVEALPTPNGVGSYSRSELLAKRKAIEARYPTRPGLFGKNKMASREMARTRHDKAMVKAERRIVLAKARNVFNVSLKAFDEAVARIDFELAELKKSIGEPMEEEGPKRKKAKTGPRKAEKPRKRASKHADAEESKHDDRPKRTRHSPGKYREPEESDTEEGELASLQARLEKLQQPDPMVVALQARLAILERGPTPMEMSEPMRAV